jgi:hypothetical protein
MEVIMDQKDAQDARYELVMMIVGVLLAIAFLVMVVMAYWFSAYLLETAVKATELPWEARVPFGVVGVGFAVLLTAALLPIVLGLIGLLLKRVNPAAGEQYARFFLRGKSRYLKPVRDLLAHKTPEKIESAQ